MNLTDDQQKKVAELEAEVKVKLEKILTPEQLQQLKQVGPPGRQGGPGEKMVRSLQTGLCLPDAKSI